MGDERGEWKSSDVGGTEGPKLLLLRVVAKTQTWMPHFRVTQLSHLPQHRLSLVRLCCKEICLTLPHSLGEYRKIIHATLGRYYITISYQLKQGSNFQTLHPLLKSKE